MTLYPDEHILLFPSSVGSFKKGGTFGGASWGQPRDGILSWPLNLTGMFETLVLEGTTRTRQLSLRFSYYRITYKIFN
jgi:hypothetical protein